MAQNDTKYKTKENRREIEEARTKSLSNCVTNVKIKITSTGEG